MEVGALQWLRWRTSCIAAAQLAQASAPRLGPQAYSHLWQFNCGIRLQKCNYLFTTFLIDQLIIPVADRFRIGCIFLRFHQIRFRFEFVVLSIGYNQSILPWFPVAMRSNQTHTCFSITVFLDLIQIQIKRKLSFCVFEAHNLIYFYNFFMHHKIFSCDHIYGAEE